jgi:hypothetical protein
MDNGFINNKLAPITLSIVFTCFYILIVIALGSFFKKEILAFYYIDCSLFYLSIIEWFYKKIKN